MKQLSAETWLGTLVAILIAGCSGRGSLPVSTVSSSAPASGTSGQGPSGSAPQNLNFTEYFQTYSSNNAAVDPARPLAVNFTVSAFYYYDKNFHWVRWLPNQFQQLVSQTYQPASYTTSTGAVITGGDAYVFDTSNNLYTLAHGTGGEYLVAHAENTGTPVIIPLNTPPATFYDMEYTADGRIAITTGNPASDQVIVVDAPLNAGSAVHRASLSSHCAYRITSGKAHDLFVTACGTFNQIYHLSSALDVISVTTVSGAQRINSLAPDFSTGGIWFTDDTANMYGKLLPDGTLTTYRPPGAQNPPDTRNVIRGVATAPNGTIFGEISGTVPNTPGRDGLVFVLEDGTLPLYAIPSYADINATPIYMRGVNGPVPCTFQLYWLSSVGNVDLVTLL